MVSGRFVMDVRWLFWRSDARSLLLNEISAGRGDDLGVLPLVIKRDRSLAGSGPEEIIAAIADAVVNAGFVPLFGGTERPV